MSPKHKNEASCCTRNQETKTKCLKRTVPKRVIKSRDVENCSENGKSCSTGVIQKPTSMGRKCTRSDQTFANRHARKESIDFCKKCGDQIPSRSENSTSDCTQSKKSTETSKSEKSKESVECKEIQDGKVSEKSIKTNIVKQYYRNENFQSSISIQEAEIDLKKMSLHTIKEVPDVSESTVNIYDVFSDSDEEIGFMDVNDEENINEMKKFRDENYFECHSVKSKIENKASVANLNDHKCAYRFYLNDRLFPVPISTDYDDSIRCVECHLPIDYKYNSSNTPNGTIQAKVRINNENQDMILLLPVKETLVIKEKRKEIKANNEVMYFGVVKLDSYGNSVFNSTKPSDSLALKYQKGYREYKTMEDFKYDGVEKDDIIVI